eukprot:scaffold4013_cov429-Prasinococcus_capsulatus_cf.AAC.6
MAAKQAELSVYVWGGTCRRGWHTNGPASKGGLRAASGSELRSGQVGMRERVSVLDGGFLPGRRRRRRAARTSGGDLGDLDATRGHRGHRLRAVGVVLGLVVQSIANRTVSVEIMPVPTDTTGCLLVAQLTQNVNGTTSERLFVGVNEVHHGDPKDGK